MLTTFFTKKLPVITWIALITFTSVSQTHAHPATMHATTINAPAVTLEQVIQQSLLHMQGFVPGAEEIDIIFNEDGGALTLSWLDNTQKPQKLEVKYAEGHMEIFSQAGQSAVFDEEIAVIGTHAQRIFDQVDVTSLTHTQLIAKTTQLVNESDNIWVSVLEGVKDMIPGNNSFQKASFTTLFILATIAVCILMLALLAGVTAVGFILLLIAVAAMCIAGIVIIDLLPQTALLGTGITSIKALHDHFDNLDFKLPALETNSGSAGGW